MKNPRKLAQFPGRNETMDELEDVSIFLGKVT
jgi:hypothetical protein